MALPGAGGKGIGVRGYGRHPGWRCWRAAFFSAAVLLAAAGAWLAAGSAGEARAQETGTEGAGKRDAGAERESPWYRLGSDGQVRLDLYVFWSLHCPHCREAVGDLQALQAELPWLDIRAFEISENESHAGLYADMAAALSLEGRYVPAFIFCGGGFQGYDSDATTGAALRGMLSQCRETLSVRLAGKAAGASGGVAVPEPAQPRQPGIAVPVLGMLDPAALSLPVLAVVLGGLDSFNPCAFFVLLFLLSLLVHARSRARMALVGGVFVLFSGLLYFLFMAAWLNVFLVVGHFRAVTVVAGALAVAVAALNIKDYFWFGRGVSLSIPERAKPGLFQRMRGLVGASSLAAMLTGTLVLAVAANAYELLCTAGFPMVFTRALTLRELPPATYYLYLALYNAVYVLPLFAIVIGFVATLGARKLGEREGRILKLLSGLMMLGLGLTLLIAPELLEHISTALILLAAAGAGTFAIVASGRLVAR